MKYLIIYLVIVNLAALIIMTADKKRAKAGRWRIPESVLLTVAFIGGSVGSIVGMLAARHITKHLKFTILLPLFFILHAVIALLLADVI